MTKFGKTSPNGQVEEATECILTGRELKAPFDTTVSHRVAGTLYFYRVVGSQYHRVTQAHMDFWAAHAGEEDLPELDAQGAPIEAEEKAAPSPPASFSRTGRRSSSAEEKSEVAE